VRFLVCTFLLLFPAGRALAQADASAAGRDGGVEAAADGGADGSPADAGAADTGAAAAGPEDEASVPATPEPARAALKGTALARGGHKPLKGATVYVDGAPVAETDRRGDFTALAEPGRHRLQIAASGHQPADVPVDLTPDGWTGIVRLAPGGPVHETVVASKPPPDAVRVEGEEARNTAGTGGDPFRVIESLPGVSQVVWPFALYAIRGANPGNTGFFVDGMRVPALFHFALGPSIVHPYLIEKLSFFPGGYPARLGGYVSGIVSAETMAPPNDTSRYAADVRLYDAGGLATAPWDGGRGTVAVAARYAYTGLIVSRLFGDVNFGYADYQLRADHTLGGGRATLLALGSFDQLDIKDNNVGDASLNFHRADLRWQSPVGGWQLLARTAFSTDSARSQLYDSPLRVRAYGAAPRIAFLKTAMGSALEVGVDGEAQHFDTDTTFATGTPLAGGAPASAPVLLADLARSRNALTLRGYATATLPFSRVTLEPGLRYAQYFEEGVTRGAFEPRLTVRVPITRALRIDATAGRFSQMPSLPVGVSGFEGFGLREFGLQSSTQTSLGVEARLPADYTLRVTGFNQWLLVTDMRSFLNRDVTQPEFLQMRPGRGYGAEVLLRLPERARLHGWLAYTLSWSTREFDGISAPSDWDQRHILNLVSAYRLPHGYSVGGRFHFNTGRPYPVQGDYQRLPAFWQVDLRADKRLIFDRMTFDVFVELGNATLNRQVTAIGASDMPGMPPSEVGFRIVLPSIGVHAEW
jgi:hypothetical protein